MIWKYRTEKSQSAYCCNLLQILADQCVAGARLTTNSYCVHHWLCPVTLIFRLVWSEYKYMRSNAILNKMAQVAEKIFNFLHILAAVIG